MASPEVVDEACGVRRMMSFMLRLTVGISSICSLEMLVTAPARLTFIELFLPSAVMTTASSSWLSLRNASRLRVWPSDSISPGNSTLWQPTNEKVTV